MSALPLPRAWSPPPGELSLFDGEMAEVALLLPAWQAEVLETTAQQQGLTTGQMLRNLIRDYCRQAQRRGRIDTCEPHDPWSSE